MTMSRRRPLKNAHAEADQFRRRAALGFLGVFVCLAGLGAWYFKLQVLDHAEYATRSEANRIKLRPVVPARGSIYDRNGVLLAENIPAFRLDVVPDQAGDPDEWLDALGKVVALDPEEVKHFLAVRKVSRGFRGITIKPKLSEEEIAALAVDRWRFPGVEVVPYLTRHYPYGPLLAHVIGYVGRVDEADLAQLGEGNSALTHVGKTGLERYYEQQLRGKVGYEKVETNVEGRALGVVGRVPAQAGTDLKLSIDIKLQQAMTEAFGQYEGAAVAMDPRTGQILGMVSLPSYDTNLFVNGISTRDFKALNENPSRPQFNRLVLGGVAPGSTIKPLMGLAGLDSGTRRPQDKILSTGMFYLPGVSRGWGDSHRGGHGWTDLRKSIAQSVNTYYYKLAVDMGITQVDAYMTKYGFGAPTGIDLAGEIGGIVPSPAYKMKSRKEAWYPGDTVNIAIGQGDWKVTPLQLVRAISGVADGQLRTPRLVMDTRNGFDQPWQPIAPGPTKPISDRPDNLQWVREGMMDTMRPGGSGYAIAVGAPYQMAGKTGTAQVVSRKGLAAVDPRSLPMHLRHRSLFEGFAPAQAPTIALAIAVEGGGYGASTAAPIARKIFDAWLLGKMPGDTPDAPDIVVPEDGTDTGAAPPAPSEIPGAPGPTPPPAPTAAPVPAEAPREPQAAP
ncbi:penicillin-binding protein 2 [Pseudoxanthomonas winnipegensis]|uniref:Peptidoglycan D,D-transpeptidase MrdA n=2 Tax=Pseudoxanthomonas winnipegensis TaxID=2480810 RepID=A0ABY1WI58_9GAMM|nr:penicillin-binding protein 2 [Pseudoxanthomonas winnipegensis]TAA22428.1 penicillin-binding protein 2 [Pseudoxanthomonas winnipegensis]TAA44140.1 penicillin-binding protein 2 [Pseudoxanthomonas winnipegensis]TAH70100.1 penicillin-binding protein 2 [Pseudoxanthomonas winnipegensis]